jgi:hypothetical protein
MDEQLPSVINAMRPLAREKIEAGHLPDRETHTQWCADCNHPRLCGVCGKNIWPEELCCRLNRDQHLHAKCYSAWWLEVRLVRDLRLEIRPLKSAK